LIDRGSVFVKFIFSWSSFLVSDISFSILLETDPLSLLDVPLSSAELLRTGLNSCALLQGLGIMRTVSPVGFFLEGTKSVESFVRSTPNMLADPFLFSPLTSARREFDACSALDPFGFAVSPSPFIPSITIAMISFLALLMALAGNVVDLFSLFFLSPP
jgi:hypothetical protein